MMLSNLALLVVALWVPSCQSFAPSRTRPSVPTTVRTTTPCPVNFMASEDGDDQKDTQQQKGRNQEEEEEEEEGSAKMSLEEKMKGWEATEEETQDATLGGIVPGQRSDAFDVGLYVAFPLMVLSGLAFALFPFIMGNLDVDSVGPPPTV